MASKPREITNRLGKIVSYRCEVYVNGIRKSVTRDTSKAAERAAAILEQEILDGKHGSPKNPTVPIRSTRTLGDLMDAYIEKELDRTKRNYRKRVGEIEYLRNEMMRGKKMGDWLLSELEYYADLPLDSDEYSPFFDWIDDRRFGKRQIKDASIRKYHTLLSSIFTRAMPMGWRWIKRHPLKGVVPKPDDSPPRDSVWTKEEVDLLCKELSYVDGTVPQKRIQEVALAFKIGLCTMQRSQEILLNTPNNVDLEAGLLWIPKEISKTGEARHVVLVKNAIELYKLALDIPRNKETIFNLTPSSKDTLFRVYRDRIGLKGKTFHDSRRTSQSMLSEHMDMQELMTSGGWKDPKIMFKVYHVQNAKKTAERLKDIEITM